MENDPKPDPDVCEHSMLSRVRKEEQIVELDGHGALQPVFYCTACGSVLYRIAPVVRKTHG